MYVARSSESTSITHHSFSVDDLDDLGNGLPLLRQHSPLGDQRDERLMLPYRDDCVGLLRFAQFSGFRVARSRLALGLSLGCDPQSQPLAEPDVDPLNLEQQLRAWVGPQRCYLRQ